MVLEWQYEDNWIVRPKVLETDVGHGVVLVLLQDTRSKVLYCTVLKSSRRVLYCTEPDRKKY